MKFFKQKLPSMNPHVESPDPDSEAESKTRGKPAAESDIPDLRGMPRTIGYANTTQTVMAINRGLLLANLALGVACVALAIGLAQSREWITVYIPPDPVAGGFQTAGMPSAPTVYGFVAQTLQQLYHWPIDGEIDYANAIDMQTPYLTTTFRRELQADFARLRNRSGLNELRGRARALHPAPERLYSPEQVQRIGPGVWGVEIEYRLVESIEASPIKDTVIRYAVRVVRADVNPNGNRWGLQLDGWLRDPVRIESEG